MTAVVLAAFEDGRAMTNAAARLGARDYSIVDAFSPYEMEGLGGSLGASPTPIRAAMLIGGLGTAMLCWFVEWYSAAIDFPFNSGARPLNSWPVFALFPFEFGVLMAGVCGFAAMLWSTGLPRLNHGFFDNALSGRVSQDRFVLAIAQPATAGARSGLARLLADAGALTVEEGQL